MGTVARPLSAEQELATQQPPHTRHPATTLQLNITTSSQLCHQDINTTTTNNMDAPQNLDPTGLYQSAASCSAQPTKSNTICSQPPHHCQDASAGPHRPLLSQDAPVPLPSDPVIGMLHPGIFLASSLLLAHSHGDLQPSKLPHASSEARLLQVTSGGNIRGGRTNFSLSKFPTFILSIHSTCICKMR